MITQNCSHTNMTAAHTHFNHAQGNGRLFECALIWCFDIDRDNLSHTHSLTCLTDRADDTRDEGRGGKRVHSQRQCGVFVIARRQWEL